MVVPCLRRPASRCRGPWRPQAFSTDFSCMAHPREGILRRPSNQAFVAVPKLKKKHISSTTVSNNQVVSRILNQLSGKWDLRASQMVEDFENSGHPVFNGLSLVGRGILKKKNNRDTIHDNGEYCNIDLLCRTHHSANQLCIYGAVTKWCGTNSEEASQSRHESARKISQKFK